MAKNLCPDWQCFDLEQPSDYNLIAENPEFFFSRYSQHLIIDEAQELPILFNILRGVIDKQRNVDVRFIIAGSSSPELLRHVSESLAGRVAIVELGTLTVNEIAHQPLSSFYELFKDKLSASRLPQSAPPHSLALIHEAWLKGGYPKPITANNEFAYQQWMENYHSTYINRDISKLFPKLNKIAYQRFLTMLSKLSGTILNKANLARSIEIAESTIKEYLTIAEGTFLWRQLPSFEKNIEKAIVKMPKGFKDQDCLHYLLKILLNLYTDPLSSFVEFCY